MILSFSKKKVAWLLCGALSLAVYGESAKANVVSDLGRSISSLWSQKEKKKAAAQTARSKARSQSEQVEFLHDRLVKTQKLLRSASDNYANYFRQMRDTEARIVETRERIAEVNERYESHRELFGRRLASMQRHGDTSFLQIALGSDSLSDLTRRTAFFNALTERDALLQEEIKADKQEVLETQNELMSEWQNRDRLQKDANQERERIAAGEKEQRRQWAAVNRARLALVNYSIQQERSSRDINGMIGSLQSRKARIVADYEATMRRERAEMRAQAVYRSRQRRRVARYVPPRRERSYASNRYNRRRYTYNRYTYNRPASTNRTYSRNRTYSVGGGGYSANRGRYRYSAQRSNLARRNGLKYAPRVDLSPQYAPRVELAPMPIESLQQPASWVSPARGSLSSRYGMRRHPVLGRVKLHTGDDIAARQGSPIRAAHSGRVVWSGWKKAYGNTVIVDVGGGMTTLYGHASKLNVRSGQTVKAGQHLGSVGSTGYATGPHLHFEVRQNGRPVNPGRFLRGTRAHT